jgi:hypothetical protein
MLDPRMVESVQQFVRYAADDGVEIQFSSAMRTPAGQDRLTGTVVPPAKDSLHLAGLAVDIKYDTVKVPSGMTRTDAQGILRASAKLAGLEWGGPFTPKPDRPHFYLEISRQAGSALIYSAQEQCKGVPQCR